MNQKGTRSKARRLITRPLQKSKWDMKIKNNDGEDWLKHDLWISKWINMHKHTHMIFAHMPQTQNILRSQHKEKRCPTMWNVKIRDEICTLKVSIGFLDFRSTQHWVGTGKKDRSSFPSFNLHMKKSGLHLEISSLLILTLLIFMKLYQEVGDFNMVAPRTLNQFSLISIGFVHPNIDIAPSHENLFPRSFGTHEWYKKLVSLACHCLDFGSTQSGERW